MDDLYLETILEEYKQPHNRGTLVNPTVSAAAKNLSCGDSLSVDLRLDANKKIIDIKWHGEGCAISVAAASLVTAHILEHQLTLKQASALGLPQILQLLGLVQITGGREKCAMLIVSALQQARVVG
jgi:nitrogen fixation NifU-like protein